VHSLLSRWGIGLFRAVLLLLGLCLAGPPLAAAPGASPAGAAPAAIEVFVREGCPHCAEAERFLAGLKTERPELEIRIRDVKQDPAAMERLQALAREHRAGGARVPAILVGGQLILGYSSQAHTDRLIRAALAGERAAAPGDAGSTCEADEGLACGAPPAAAPEVFELEFFGRTLSLDDIGLPAFTVAMGLLDGFNPCSMWVLLLMISMLAPLNDRRRMLAVAGTFVVVEGIAYFVFMAAWLNLFLLIGLSRVSQLVIAAIAIAAGLINVKDFFAFGRGISLSIPGSAKPRIYQRIRDILQARNLGAAILATIVLALLVQIVELMCTSGFPALYTRILTLRELPPASYYGYLLLYIAAYMLDDVIVLGIGVTMLSRHRLQEKEGRWLKLMSGAVMIGLGVYLLIAD
jgi:glutaredoxin